MVGLVYRKSELYRIIAVTLIFFTTGIVCPPLSMGAPAPSQEARQMSAGEKKKLVQEAVAYFEQKDMAKAQESLERAKTEFPENYAVPYYLGLVYLEKGDRKAAIAQWQEYIKLDPDSENALAIRKNITILLREQAQEAAKQAVAQESKLAAGKADDKTIAIMNFRNLGSDELGPLGKGMASMLISDLSKIQDLNVVDRIKLQALIEEMKLGRSGLVDMNSAPKVGKLLKAKHVTSGTLADIENENLIVASAVVDTDKNASVGAQEAKGEIKTFYEIEKAIACQIVEDIGKDCDKAPAGFNKIHTKSMPALVAYSKGLDYFDNGDYDEARDAFQNAIDHDSQFDLAIAALLATPPTSMAAMDKTQMISKAASSGPPSATAGTAVAGSTAAVVATSSTGLSPLTMIVGGVVIVGGGAALAGGGGGGGGGGPTPQNTDTLSLTGDWKGTWDAESQATFSMTQTNDAVSGTISLTGDSCMTTGQISGSVAGNAVTLTLQSDQESIALDATVNKTDKTLTGTLNYQASATPTCIGRTGNFSVILTTGDADIGW